MSRSDFIILILSGLSLIGVFWRIQYERKLEAQNAYFREVVKYCNVKPNSILL